MAPLYVLCPEFPRLFLSPLPSIDDCAYACVVGTENDRSSAAEAYDEVMAAFIRILHRDKKLIEERTRLSPSPEEPDKQPDERRD